MKDMNNGPLVPEIGVVALVPDDWDVSWQPRHHVLTRLSRYFHVAWVNPAPEWRELAKAWYKSSLPKLGETADFPGFLIYRSHVLPKLYRPEWVATRFYEQRLKNARRMLVGRGCQKIVLYIWRPEFEPAVHMIAHDASCYHIDDEYSFSEIEVALDPTEIRLMQEVDQVFIHSPGLLEKKGAINPRTVFVPNGCDYQAYSQPQPEPSDLAGIPHPRIGYTGRIKRQLDWLLITELATKHPQWSFVFVGPVTQDPGVAEAVQRLSDRPNIHFLGYKSTDQLAAYPQHFDVCIMPYRLNDYTRYIYPLKLHEYLASGRPAVGSPVLSLVKFGHLVRLARTTDEWSSAIQDCLNPAACMPAMVSERQSVARRHDWDSLVKLIALTICERLGDQWIQKIQTVAPLDGAGSREPQLLIKTPVPVNGDAGTAHAPVALQRCDRFVARTMNWLYDHLRFVSGYAPVVLCDALQNREEFPELEARCFNRETLPRQIWRSIAGNRPTPYDAWRLNRLHPQILHSHFGYVATHDVELQQALDVPWLVSFYGADVYEVDFAERDRMYAQVFEHADRVLALGPTMAARLELLGCPRERIVIHPLGVDVENLPQKPRVLKTGAPLKILFAGTFREKKGIPYVVEAISLAKRAGMSIELYMVAGEMGKAGELETKQNVFEQIRRLDLEKNVVYKPLMPFRDLVQLALDAHIFVAPSVTASDGDAEGTPFVLQQMMATAMPVIATAHSDIPYLFGEYADRLVAERDAEGIAAQLAEYAAHPDRLVQDGRALRERIRSAFNVKECADRLSALYDRLQ
jgi:colanic acid/amylovoran biosynthesis glycosyltransferase